MEKDTYAASRRYYIAEAAFEYLIDILIGSAYLAKIASSLGMSDARIGILSSFVSLAATARLAALLLVNRTPVRRWIIPLHITNQLAYAALYFVPLLSGGKRAGAFVFAGLLLFGQIVANLVGPAKLNWFMSLVDDKKRGVFTANKEIISLFAGMAFSYLMSAIIDHFEAKGQLDQSFLLIGCTIIVLMLLHTSTLVLSKEKPVPRQDIKISENFSSLMHNKTFWLIIVVSLLWSVINYATRPFFGSYEIHELGFSMKFASLLTIAGSLTRAFFSRPMGRYADRHSFCGMLMIGFTLEGLSFLAGTFAAPGNGKVLYTLYTVLHYIAMAGINSGELNLIFDYVTPTERTGALAIKNALAGLLGFLTTVVTSSVVAKIQEGGNQVLGHTVYAQQLLSLFGCLGCIIMVLYIGFSRGHLRRPEPDGTKEA